MTVDVHALLSGSIDTREWRRRHAEGLVPDAYPYGLDRMAQHGFQVRDTTGDDDSAPVRLARGAVRKLGGGMDWLGGALTSTSADVVLSWDERLGIPAAVKLGRHTPVVTNVIWAAESRRTVPVRRAMTAGLRRARMVFVHSSAQVPVLRDVFGVEERKLVAFPFGVDASFFTPRPGPDEIDRDLLVSVGNDRNRDFATVLKAFARIRRHRPSSRLVIVSSAIDPRLIPADAGISLVRQLNHAELRDLVSRAVASLILTRRNTHVSGATALLETMALGRPAVGTANPGMSDYAIPDGGMRLVPVGDAAAAADECLRLLQDPDAADELGRQGRAAVTRVFNTEAHAGRLAEVLRTACG